MTILLGIVGAIVGIYNKISQNSFEKDISQNSMLIMNIKDILDNISNDINGSDIQKLYNTFPVSSSDGNFRALIQIKPLFDKIDINEYADKNRKKYIDRFLDNILEFYQLKDPILFKSLIEDTIDNDDIERVGDSEIKLKNPFFKNGKIYSYKHFKQILDYYSKTAEDKTVYKIPWKKLVYFGDGNEMIDCNIIKSQVAKFLGLMYDEENLNCKSLQNDDENKDILKKLSIIPFNKKISYLVDIKINYNNENLNILYDINKKRIKDIKSSSIY